MRRRPTGITILAVLFAVNVALFLVLAAVATFDRDALRVLLHALSPSGAGPEAMHTAMGRMLPLYYMFMAGVTTTLAIGFWKLCNWARVVMLGMIVLSLVLMATEVPRLLATPTSGAISLTLVRVVLSVLWLWYLFRRPVRDAFQRERDKTTASGVAEQIRKQLSAIPK